MILSFKTISKPAKGQFKDRGSKFFAFAYPVKNENDIKDKLDLLKKKYHDARHHCYAWKLGADQGLTRANDDGEPSNSAGKPILNSIEHYKLTNILVVVIRYFGGTLLGVGGLINAYRSAARDVLANSSILKVNIKKTYKIEFQYPELNSIMKLIKDYKLESHDQLFEIDCSMILKIELEKEEEILEKLKLIEACTFKLYDEY